MTTATLERKPAKTDRANEVLKEVFGFDEYRSGQEQAIANCSPGIRRWRFSHTGAARACVINCPILLDGLTVVISPLIALMKDQLDFLREKKDTCGATGFNVGSR